MKDEKTHPNSGKFSLSILLYAGLWNSGWRWSESTVNLSPSAIPWIEEKYRENPASGAGIHWLVPWKPYPERFPANSVTYALSPE